MRVIGIDPGITGAVAILRDGRDPQVFDTPAAKVGAKNDYLVAAMADLIVGGMDIEFPKATFADICIVAIEKVHSMPGMGAVSAFSFGRGAGLWEGIVAGLGIPYELVTPQRWKKAMMDGMTKEKESSRVRVMQLFPSMSGELKYKKDHGRADALLIAEWRRRQL